MAEYTPVIGRWAQVPPFPDREIGTLGWVRTRARTHRRHRSGAVFVTGQVLTPEVTSTARRGTVRAINDKGQRRVIGPTLVGPEVFGRDHHPGHHHPREDLERRATAEVVRIQTVHGDPLTPLMASDCTPDENHTFGSSR